MRSKLAIILLNLALICITCAEGFVGYLYVTQHVSFVLLLAVHLLLTVFFVLAFRQLRHTSSNLDANFSLISLTLSALLPVYGMVGIVLIYFSTMLIHMEPIRYFDVDADIRPFKLDVHLHAGVDNVVQLKHEELEIDAFRDVFAGHDPAMEESAVNKLSKIVSKESVAILKEVVQTSTSDTGVLAASALIDMEDKIIHRIEKIRAQLSQDPENPDAILALARAYDLYCYLDVLDPAVLAHYRYLALEQYQTYFMFKPDDFEASVEYGRILVHSGKYQEAIDVLRHAAQLQPQSPSPYIWLAEAQYELGNYDEVSATCRKLTAHGDLPEHFRTVGELWLDSPVHA